MDNESKLQQKWARLVLGFSLEEFTDLHLASGFVKHSKKGKLGFSMNVFESAINHDEDADADVQLVTAPIRHDAFKEMSPDFKKNKT